MEFQTKRSSQQVKVDEEYYKRQQQRQAANARTNKSKHPPDANSSELESDVSSSQIYFGIMIKKQFNILQLASIPTISLCTVMVGVYMNA
jgi:hypothetical protein